MSRLNKQCVIASTGFHILLLALLLLVSGFHSTPPPKDPALPFNMLPSSVIESLLNDPADTLGESTEHIEPQPEPQVTEPEPVPDPLPEPEIEEPSIPEESPVELPPEPEKTAPAKPAPDQRKPEPSKEVIARATPKPTQPKQNPLKKANEIRINTQIQTGRPTPSSKPRTSNRPLPKISGSVSQNLSHIGKGSTIRGPISMEGNGAGSYILEVQAAYDAQWSQPRDLSRAGLTVKVKVVVASDGKIQSATITQRSGLSTLDASVQQLLDEVRRIPKAPPAGLTASERTFILNFNIKR